MGKKESSQEMSSLAGRILLQGYQPTRDEIESLAASVAGQDETRGAVSGRPRKPLDAELPPLEETPTQEGEDE